MHASNQKQKQKKHSIHGAVRRLYLHTNTTHEKRDTAAIFTFVKKGNKIY